jgi:sortase A
MKHNFPRIGTSLILGGLFLLTLAALLVFHNLWEDRQAGQTSAQVLRQLLTVETAAPQKASDPVPTTLNASAALEEGQVDPTAVPLYVRYPELEMPTVDIDGHAYIGRLDIPVLSLSLPVMSNWSYDNLKLAPCRYAGSAYQENLVIAAHNYKSHFRDLKTLTPGDPVYVTDVDGNVFSYTVAELQQLSPTEVEAMEHSGYPLTLFTCTVGGSYRLAVRCVAAS